MTHQDQNAAVLNQLEEYGEEMFCRTTIEDLGCLVDEVMRTHETNIIHSSSGDLNGMLDLQRL
jgi:hypothetical protein